jgi:hypothetical protein
VVAATVEVPVLGQVYPEELRAERGREARGMRRDEGCNLPSLFFLSISAPLPSPQRHAPCLVITCAVKGKTPSLQPSP